MDLVSFPMHQEARKETASFICFENLPFPSGSNKISQGRLPQPLPLPHWCQISPSLRSNSKVSYLITLAPQACLTHREERC